jgi:hypothetical protein
MYACTHGLEEVAMRIMDFGDCKLDFITPSGETSFMLACFKRLKRVCHRMMDLKVANIEKISKNGITAFMAQYGEIVTDVTLGQFYANVSGGTVNLYLTPTNAFNTVKMIRTLITI